MTSRRSIIRGRDLNEKFGLGPLLALNLKDTPGQDVGGKVFIMEHVCYSLNLQVGDGGWQSEGVLYSREAAERAAAALAMHFGAEMDL